jgi:hypothetical protein
MNKAIWGMLNDGEKALLREAEPAALRELDEDSLAELHDRVRRARNKYSKLYRRRASAQVAADASRARAHPKHARTAAKAEAFEDALARVSRQLAKAAKASADELRAERLEAARRSKGAGPAKKKAASKRKVAAPRGGATPKRRTPASKRASASARATTRRSQARRDSR